MTPRRSSTLPLCLALLVVSCAGSPSDSGDVDPDPNGLREGRVQLTHLPMELSGAESYIGMGDPNVVPKAHGGFLLANPFTLPATVPVFAVADGVVTNVRRGVRTVPDWGPPESRGQDYEDWGFEIRISTTMRVDYGHVSRLHPHFKALVGDPPADEIGRSASIPVQAGDTLGFLGPHQGFDFSLSDRDRTHQFLNPSRYPVDYIYSADVTEYFSEPERSQLLAITLRQLPPRGGKHDYDVQGRIVGNWFREGTTSFTQWSRQLALVYHHIEGDLVIISDGSPMTDGGGLHAGAPDLWRVRGNAPDPVTVGVEEGLVKYDLMLPHTMLPDDQLATEGVMLVQLTDPGTLRVETFPGMLPHEVHGFTAAARTYVR